MAEKKEKVGFFGSIKNFFKRTAKYVKDVISEMKKVTWPTKSQIINNTLIVIAVSIIAAVFIYGLDTILALVLKFVLTSV